MLKKKIKKILAFCLIFSMLFSVAGLPMPAQAAVAEQLRVMDQNGNDLLTSLTAYSRSTDYKYYSESGSPLQVSELSTADDLFVISEEPNGENTNYRMWVTPAPIDSTVDGAVYAKVYQPDIVGDNYRDIIFNIPSGKGEFVLDTHFYSEWWSDNFYLYNFALTSGDSISIDKLETKVNFYNIMYSAQADDDIWEMDFNLDSSSDTIVGGTLQFEINIFGAPTKNAIIDALSAQKEEKVAAQYLPQNEYYFKPDKYVMIDIDDIYDQYGNYIYDIYKNEQQVMPEMEILTADGTSLATLEFGSFGRGYVWEMPQGPVADQYILRIFQDTGPYAGVVSQDLILIPDSQKPVITVNEPQEDSEGNIIISGNVTDNEALEYVYINVDGSGRSWYPVDSSYPLFAYPNVNFLEGTFSEDGKQFNFTVKLMEPADGNHKIEIYAEDRAENYAESYKWFNYPLGNTHVISVSPENDAVITDGKSKIEVVVDLPLEDIDTASTKINMQWVNNSGYKTPEFSSNADGTTTLTVYAPAGEYGWLYNSSDERDVQAELHLYDNSGNDFYHTWQFRIDTRAPYLHLQSANLVGEDANPFRYVRAGNAEIVLYSNEKIDLAKSKFYIAPNSGTPVTLGSVNAQMLETPEIPADAQAVKFEYDNEYEGYYYKASYQVTENMPDGPATVFGCVYDLLGNYGVDTEYFLIDNTPPEITRVMLIPEDMFREDKAIMGSSEMLPAEKTFVSNDTPLALVVEYRTGEGDAPLYVGSGDFSAISAKYAEPLELKMNEMRFRSLGSESSAKVSEYWSDVFIPTIEGGYVEADRPSYEDGEKTFALELSDMAGNKTSVQGTVVIDNIPPQMDMTVEPLADNQLKLTVKANEEFYIPDTVSMAQMPWIFTGPLTEAESNSWLGGYETYMGQNYGAVPVAWTVYDNNTYVGIIDDPGKPQLAAVAVDKAENLGVSAYCNYTFNAAEGIEIGLADGTAINIPAGAVVLGGSTAAGADGDTVLTINAVLPDQGSLAEYFLAGGSLKMKINGQEHYTFAKPVTITIPELGAGLAGKTSLAYYNEDSAAWELLQTERVETEKGVFLTTEVNHFSQFAAIADITAPEIVIEAPANNSETTASSINIKGKTESGLNITVTNGTISQSIKAGNNGYFETSVSLAVGLNTIYITTADWAGNTAEKTIKITRKSSGGGGRSTSPDLLEQAEEDADDASKNIIDTNLSEEELVNSTEEASNSLNDSADTLQTDSDIDRFSDIALKVSDAITQAADKIQSEDTASRVTENASKITEALAKAAVKAQTAYAKQKLTDSAVSSLDAFKKSAEKIVSPEKAAEAAKLHAKAFNDIKVVMEANAQAKDTSKLVLKTAEVLEGTAKLLNKVADAQTAAAVAEEIIGSMSALTLSAKNNSTDNNVKSAVKKAEEKVVNVVEKALEKAGTVQITNNASINIESIAEKAAAIAQKAKEFSSKLEQSGIESNKELTKQVSLEISSVAGADEMETDLPANVFDAIAANNIKKLEVKSQVADFAVTGDTFGEAAKGKNIVLGAKQVTRANLSASAQAKVPVDSAIVDLNAAVGDTKVSKFNDPLEVAIPYTLKQGDNPDAVTVFLLKDNGEIEPVGGKFDPVTGKVRFITNHFSKYFAKSAVKEFKDIAKYSWAQKQVETMAGKGIIKGRSANQFYPAADITRAEFAALAVRMMKLENNNASNPFKDVTADAWYAKEVAAAYADGLIKGKTANEFNPNGKISREEMAVIISRILQKQGYKTADKSELSAYKDLEQAAPWAKAELAMAVREGIINGLTSSKIAPKEAANRAQTAVMLYRLYNK